MRLYFSLSLILNYCFVAVLYCHDPFTLTHETPVINDAQ